jgi:hypothetical protein
MSDSPATNGELSANRPDDEMESRMRRLENAIAAIADTRDIEERVLEKMKSRVEPQPPVAALAPPVQSQPPPALPVPPEMLVAAGQALLPSALNAMSAGLAAATDPRNAQPQQPSLLSPQAWLMTDLLMELRSFGMMFLDFRFRPSWTVRIVPLACLAMIVLNYFLLTALPERLFDIFLVVLAYKSLARDAARYRQEMALLPPRGGGPT